MRNLLTLALACSLIAAAAPTLQGAKRRKDPKIKTAVAKGLDYLARSQRRMGYWEANSGQYRIAMTALAGNAMLCEGSTTTRGKYAENIRRAVDYLIQCARPNGLIGFENDYRYTYGHGFSMLFLSQVYGEEEDEERREDLKRVLTNAVVFSAQAQTNEGGWGYVSAKDGRGFDEGSTCITQVQGLRACRNAGIPVPKEIIDKAKSYIARCTTADGGVRYSLKSGGGARPAITGAACAALFNAGEHDTPQLKKMLTYCERNVWPGNSRRSFGHWHYTHFYYSQVMYRLGDEKWNKYIDQVSNEILRKQNQSTGGWTEGSVGPVYVTAINTTILQIDNGYLPIYQR